MSVQLIKHKFTVDEYRKMAEMGVLKEGDRVELIRGEIIEMSPIGTRHAACVRRLNLLFSEKLGKRALCDTQNPIQLGNNSQPQPDVTLLQPRDDFYATQHPQPADIFLVVEVADTTLEGDRSIKIPLYAEHDITEVWLVNLPENCLEVYRQPTPTGYQIVSKFYPGDTLSLQTFPDISINVNQILS
ncbi:Uma2 family endonuclease [Laspinema olomoucense]|uniref:Uma2 family endonuclease n=1 Tax=Laspinema olomoucense TaxID=3231600 RepID=UPI0021BA5572|nr:Uma2 family endonuclease [Laspinema sp. D3a]MCT7987041.1 Uma2 family endonuclease [Laspinema sp. D3a]